MRGDTNKYFKITNEIMIDIFSTFFLELEIYCQDKLKKVKSTY